MRGLLRQLMDGWISAELVTTCADRLEDSGE